MAAYELEIRRYGRHWAVYENGALLAVCCYRKGARAIVGRLSRKEGDGGELDRGPEEDAGRLLSEGVGPPDFSG